MSGCSLWPGFFYIASEPLPHGHLSFRMPHVILSEVLSNCRTVVPVRVASTLEKSLKRTQINVEWVVFRSIQNKP